MQRETVQMLKLCSRQFSIKPTARQSTDALDSHARETWKNQVLQGSDATVLTEDIQYVLRGMCQLHPPTTKDHRAADTKGMGWP